MVDKEHLWRELAVLYRDASRPDLAYPCYLKALPYNLEMPVDWRRAMIYDDLLSHIAMTTGDSKTLLAMAKRL